MKSYHPPWGVWSVRVATAILSVVFITCGDDDPTPPSNNSAANNNAANNNSAANNNTANNNVTALAWPIERVTVGAMGIEADDDTNQLVVSQDGRYAAFVSLAENIGDISTAGVSGVFIRDRMADSTLVVNRNNDDELMGGSDISISDDGTKVLFESRRNLFDDDQRSARAVFLRFVDSSSTSIVSLTNDGQRINGDASDSTLSGDGRFVVFGSSGLNLPVPSRALLYVRDLVNNTTTLIAQSDGTPSNRATLRPDISDDGSRVVFESQATNLVTGTTGTHVFLVSGTGTGPAELISANDNNEPANAFSNYGTISGDGRYVVFSSTATNLVTGTPQNAVLLYLRDTMLGTTIVASVDENGEPISAAAQRPGISDDGQYIAFATSASGASTDTDSQSDIYLFDRVAGTSRRMSLTFEAADPDQSSLEAVLSGDGSTVGFLSPATSMVPSQGVPLINDGYVVDVP